jgi:large repetitive protein
MTRTRLRVRGLLLACVLGLGLITAGRANALTNGDPCSPFWTEDTPPIAAFSASPATALTFEAVQFDSSGSTHGTADKWTFVSVSNTCEATSTADDPIASYTWDFGDGSPPETDPAPWAVHAHAYTTPGTYMVTLIVTEKNCQAGQAAHCFTNSLTKPITVQNRPPVASFTTPASVATGRPASLDASSSSDLDGHVTSYHWDFGDGQSQDTAGPLTFHTYSRSGPMTVTLTVTDDRGAIGQRQEMVPVRDRPPTASFAAPAAIGKGQAASFDASASFDPDGTITSYRWDFGDGQTRTTTAASVSHTYTQRGPKTVTLTVTDDNGNTDHTPRTLAVTTGLPRPSFSAPATVTVEHAARFDASASSDPDGNITGYRWDFGDGQTQTTTVPAVSHTYHASGTMTVTLTITDDNGAGAAARRTINVLPRACVVPRLLGRKLGGAWRALKGAGCRLGTVKRKHTPASRRGRVIRQSIRTGAVRPAGLAVAVTVGK